METAARSALIRRLASASLVGQLIWFVGVSIAGLPEPGYSELRDPVSALGADNAAHPWVFNLLVAVWGASFLAAAAALWLEGPGASGGIAAGAPFAALSVGLLALPGGGLRVKSPVPAADAPQLG